MNRAIRVHEILADCFYTDVELGQDRADPLPAGTVVVEAIRMTCGLHPGRLKSHEAEILEVLTGLPDQFYQQKGGGWTFLNLCMDANGEQWGEHRNCEELCILAIAIGRGHWILPRELWSALPGGMPYIVFDLLEGVH